MTRRLSSSRLSIGIVAGLCLGMAWLAWRPSPATAVTEQEISILQNKNLLNETDLQAINGFVNEQFESLLRETDPASLDQYTNALVNYSSSNTNNNVARRVYNDRYATAVNSAYTRLFANPSADATPTAAQSLAATIVLARLDNSIIKDTLVGQLNHSSPTVRYWAAKGLAQDAIQQELLGLSGGSEELQAYFESLTKAVEQTTAGTPLAQIVTAGALPNTPLSLDLAKAAIQQRLKAYRSWTNVHNELSDLAMLRAIFSMVNRGIYANDQSLQNQLMRPAVELYSAAFDRYAMGFQYTTSQGQVLTVLTDKNIVQLRTVLIEAEWLMLRLANSNAPRRVLGAMQKPPVQQTAELETAYTALLGSNGPINQAFNIVQPDQAGQRTVSRLPDPPKTLINRARALSNTLDID